MKDFIDYCKDYVIDHIDEHIGRDVYLSDFGFELTEDPNCNGTLTYSTHDAMEYLREWWWEAGEYWKYEKDNFGTNIHNPFENPEAYMVCMVIEGVNTLISAAISKLGMDDEWNCRVEITKRLAGRIKKAVREYDLDSLF